MKAARRYLRSAGSLLVAGIILSGCASLPSSGPTAHEIVKSEAKKNAIGFRIVSVDAHVIADVSREDEDAGAQPSPLAKLAPAATGNDLVGPGDVLQISVFEVGVSLFSAAQGTAAAGFEPAANAQVLPPVTVDGNGDITLPYAGHLHIAGQTTQAVQRIIEGALRPYSQKPQVLVALGQNISNTVILFGAIQHSGRYPLSLGRERLLDAIAIGGGLSASAEDTVVRVNRGSMTIEERLGRIRAGDPGDVQLVSGDRIEFIKRPRTFLILGASSHVSQVSFETGDVSLAEAVARAGGPNDSQADPSAVFLFRYDAHPGGGAVQPVVYRLNMMNPESYFLAQRFIMRDKDIVYIGNAGTNQLSKFVSIMNQLFSPVVAARVAAGSN